MDKIGHWPGVVKFESKTAHGKKVYGYSDQCGGASLGHYLRSLKKQGKDIGKTEFLTLALRMAKTLNSLHTKKRILLQNVDIWHWLV